VPHPEVADRVDDRVVHGGVAPIVPASPMPVAPSGLTPVGVSLESSSKLGSSAAVIVA
jgi:hypothetical protein